MTRTDCRSWALKVGVFLSDLFFFSFFVEVFRFGVYLGVEGGNCVFGGGWDLNFVRD